MRITTQQMLTTSEYLVVKGIFVDEISKTLLKKHIDKTMEEIKTLRDSAKAKVAALSTTLKVPAPENDKYGPWFKLHLVAIKEVMDNLAKATTQSANTEATTAVTTTTTDAVDKKNSKNKKRKTDDSDKQVEASSNKKRKTTDNADEAKDGKNKKKKKNKVEVAKKDKKSSKKQKKTEDSEDKVDDDEHEVDEYNSELDEEEFQPRHDEEDEEDHYDSADDQSLVSEIDEYDKKPNKYDHMFDRVFKIKIVDEDGKVIQSRFMMFGGRHEMRLFWTNLRNAFRDKFPFDLERLTEAKERKKHKMKGFDVYKLKFEHVPAETLSHETRRRLNNNENEEAFWAEILFSWLGIYADAICDEFVPK